MLNIALGAGVLAIAVVFLFIFRARDGVPHPAMLTMAGKCVPLASVGLVVLGVALVIEGLFSQWALP